MQPVLCFLYILLVLILVCIYGGYLLFITECVIIIYFILFFKNHYSDLIENRISCIYLKLDV